MKLQDPLLRQNYPQLVVRKIDFELSENIAPVWNPHRPEWSHMVNGASLTMPYLEPFLIRTMREASKQIDDPELLEEMRDFNAQEGQHFQHHAKFNSMLKDSGYSDLQLVEDEIANDYRRFKSKSLKWRLAYTAGFETMTVGITEWLINDRAMLFKSADTRVVSFILWHMVEETEHKNVAIDAFNHLYPNSYLMRIWGMCVATSHIALASRRGYRSMLKKDGRWNQLASRWGLWKMVTRFMVKVAPAMFRALRPNYHPAKVEDPKWAQQWVTEFSHLPEGCVPLLNTSSNEISPRFEAIVG